MHGSTKQQQRSERCHFSVRGRPGSATNWSSSARHPEQRGAGSLGGVIRRPERKDLEAAAELLGRLAAAHGLSDLHLGLDPGELVATVAEDRTYFDIVAFEDEVESRLGWRPTVVPSTAPGARPGPKLTGQISAA